MLKSHWLKFQSLKKNIKVCYVILDSYGAILEASGQSTSPY